MTTQPHHIAFTVNNLTESIQWYIEKLGFRLIHKYKSQTIEIAHIILGNVRIELFNFAEKTQLLPDYRNNLLDDLHVVGTKHLCIEVDDLDAMINKLKDNDVELATTLNTTSFGGEYIFFKDCNGILIELYQS